MVTVPASNAITHGTTSGSISSLATRDQSGRFANPSRGMVLTPDGSGYSSAFHFNGNPASPVSITLNINYRGPLSTTELWQFKIWDANGSAWVLLGDNSSVTKVNTWTVISFVASGTLAHYVDGGGVILIQVLTSATATAIRLDQMGLQIVTNTSQFPPFPIGNGLLFDGDWTKSDQSQVNFVAAHTIVVTEAGPNGINGIKTANPAVIALWYQKVAGVHTTDSIYPYVVLHDLFAYDGTGTKVTNPSNGWFYIDIIDNTKRGLWITGLVADQASNMAFYDGIRYDNVVTLIPTFPDQVSALPNNYTQDAWYSALATVMAGFQAGYPTKITMWNGYNGSAPAGFRGMELLPPTKGMYFEGFAYKTNLSPYTDAARWLQVMTDFASGDSTKSMTGLDYTLSTDTQKRIYSLGSYLCITHPTSFWYLVATDGTVNITYFSEYGVAIGQPLGPMAASGSLYIRQFTLGFVVVNPDTSSSHNYTISGVKNLYIPTGTSGNWPNNAGVSYIAQANNATISMPANSALIFKN